MSMVFDIQSFCVRLLDKEKEKESRYIDKKRGHKIVKTLDKGIYSM